jgi:hypothetical protein
VEAIDNKVIGALNRISAYATAARRANGVSWRLAPRAARLTRSCSFRSRNPARPWNR